MSPRHRWHFVALGAAALGMAVLLFVFNPSEGGPFPPCPTWTLAGVYCPGCGAARASHQLLHGRVEEALRYNSLLVLMLPVLAWLVLRPRILPAPPWWTSRAVLATALVFTALRNVPAWPFSLLAPPPPISRVVASDKLPR